LGIGEGEAEDGHGHGKGEGEMVGPAYLAGSDACVLDLGDGGVEAGEEPEACNVFMFQTLRVVLELFLGY
jgi:hypothetical protein